jgi:hypothetical protein
MPSSPTVSKAAPPLSFHNISLLFFILWQFYQLIYFYPFLCINYQLLHDKLSKLGENPSMAQPTGHVCPVGKKKPWASSPFFPPFNKQKIGHQPEPLTHGKPPYTLLNWTQSQEVSAMRKAACHFSPPASFKTACLNLQTQQASNTHHPQLSYPPLGTQFSTAPRQIEPHFQQNWKA